VAEAFIRYFLLHKLVQERHSSDLALYSKPKRKTPSVTKNKVPYIATTGLMINEVKRHLSMGFTPFRISKYLGIPRSRVYEIQKDMIVKSGSRSLGAELMSIPGAKDITEDINTLRISLKAEKACDPRVPEEIMFNGKKYKEILD
jgi:hypothetical protein